MRVNGFVLQSDAGQLISCGQPNQSGYVGTRISLSFSGSGEAALEQKSINALAGGMKWVNDGVARVAAKLRLRRAKKLVDLDALRHDRKGVGTYRVYPDAIRSKIKRRLLGGPWQRAPDGRALHRPAGIREMGRAEACNTWRAGSTAQSIEIDSTIAASAAESD
jgi:hypothetical protein